MAEPTPEQSPGRSARQLSPEPIPQLTRRQVLAAAGFAVAGGAAVLSSGCSGGDDEPSGGATGEATTTGAPPTSNAADGAGEFSHLFSPLTIGAFEVRNRILSTAHHTSFAVDGLPSARHVDYWAAKARGGIGMIITEITPVHPSASFVPSMIQAYRPEVVDAFGPVVEAVHEHGAKLVAQLWHGGDAYPIVTADLVSASAVPASPGGRVPRALSVADIDEIVESYAVAAERMRAAGLDGVEIHMGHGYLPLQFLSPLRNHRDDDYGGDEERRMRFPREVIDAVRAAVGDDFTVGIRINGDEFQPGGLTVDDMARITPELTASGKLDFVNVSLGGLGIISPMGIEHGRYVYLAERIREVVDVPVCCIGRIIHPGHADEIVGSGRADMVGMTRANMTDPELPNKARQGRTDEIRHCVGLMECWRRISTGHPDGVSCALNPTVGHEEELAIDASDTRMRVMVVGGGIAGLEAARVTAERGHEVTLHERSDELGGQLLLAARLPTRGEMLEPVAWYRRQLELLGVEVRLDQQVTPEDVDAEGADVVIVATGGVPAPLEVPGGDDPIVVQGRDVLAGRVEVGERVVVVSADGGMEGLGTAEFLADEGHSVELLRTEAPGPQAGIELITLANLTGRLDDLGVVITAGVTVDAIESGGPPGEGTGGEAATGAGATGGTVVVSGPDDQRRISEVDNVVLCLGSLPDDELIGELGGAMAAGEAQSGTGPAVYAVGQCHQPGGIAESVADALRTARLI